MKGSTLLTFPTDNFTNSDPQNPSIHGHYVAKNLRYARCIFLKLWNEL